MPRLPIIESSILSLRPTFFKATRTKSPSHKRHFETPIRLTQKNSPWRSSIRTGHEFWASHELDFGKDLLGGEIGGKLGDDLAPTGLVHTNGLVISRTNDPGVP